MDDFKSAHAVAFDVAKSLSENLDPEAVAESMIVVGLALWGAHTGRKESAEAVLRVFDYERGRVNGD